MDEAQKTRRRILEAACEVFAEKGYRDATVHDLCAAAKANVAAVNYYFGSKKNLYLEVWKHLHVIVREQYFERIRDIADPADRLREIIAQRVRHVFDDGPAGRLRLITYREMNDPAEFHKEIRDRFIMPNVELVTRTVAELFGRPESDAVVRRCAFSVQSQLVSLARLRTKPDPSAIRRLMGDSTPAPEQIRELIEHLVTFVSGGIRATITTTETTGKPQ